MLSGRYAKSKYCLSGYAAEWEANDSYILYSMMWSLLRCIKWIWCVCRGTRGGRQRTDCRSALIANWWITQHLPSAWLIMRGCCELLLFPESLNHQPAECAGEDKNI